MRRIECADIESNVKNLQSTRLSRSDCGDNFDRESVEKCNDECLINVLRVSYSQSFELSLFLSGFAVSFMFVCCFPFRFCALQFCSVGRCYRILLLFSPVPKSANLTKVRLCNRRLIVLFVEHSHIASLSFSLAWLAFFVGNYNLSFFYCCSYEQRVYWLQCKYSSEYLESPRRRQKKYMNSTFFLWMSTKRRDRFCFYRLRFIRNSTKITR